MHKCFTPNTHSAHTTRAQVFGRLMDVDNEVEIPVAMSPADAALMRLAASKGTLK